MAEWVCSRGGECCRATESVEVSPSELQLLQLARPDVRLVVRQTTRGTLEFRAGPCPLLGENGSCTVYDVRPWRCRAWSCYRKPGQAYSPVVLYERLGESAGVRRAWRQQLDAARSWADTHGWTHAYEDLK
jgi:Fe-S-cluster containining protein